MSKYIASSIVLCVSFSLSVIIIALTTELSTGIVEGTKEPTSEPIMEEEHTEEPLVRIDTIEREINPVEVAVVNDPQNYIYPYNIMSADWGADLYESGFKYYELPKEYIATGGCLPAVVQVYIWSLCKELDLNYYVIIAQIERESGYRWNATGDSGNSKGYMQIYEKWNKDRMEAEGVTDLYDPYGNIRVGLSLMAELKEKSNGDYHYMLMSYNMGEGKCKARNREGVYSTAYSRGILQRAQEIEQEIQG